MLTNKQKELLEMLIHQEGISTVENYAKRIAVSKRTVYTYLDIIQPELKKRGFEIEKIRGKGINIIGTHTTSKEDLEIDEFSVLNRRIEIIYLLYIKRCSIDIYDFCDEFYVSESSVRNDLIFLNQKIKDIHEITISIVQGKIVLQGQLSNQNIFNCLIQLNELLLYSHNYTGKLRGLSQLYDQKIIRIVDKLINDYISDVSLDLAEYYKVNLVSVFVVMTSQVMSGYHIQSKENQLVYDRVKFLPNLILAKQFFARLEQMIDVHFTEEDCEFLAEYLIADRIQIHNFEKISAHDKKIFERILQKMEILLKVDFSKNVNNREKLLLHFNAMVFRLRKGINLKNDFLSAIKKEFELLFNLTWIVLESESEELKIKITEDEVGYLLIHFQSFIDQQRQAKKILLICPYGMATSEMVLNRLRQILPAFDSIEVTSVEKARHCNLDSIDFIVSTVDIQDFDKPVVRVSSIITEDDVKNIMTFYQKVVLNTKHTESLYLHTLVHYVDNHLIFHAKGSKESIIKEGCQILEDNGYVEKEYYQSMMYREKIGSTDNIYQCALPHGDIKYVKKTVINFAILDKAVKWKNHNVKFVIFFNISKQDLNKSREILGDIYKLIHSKQLKELLKGKSEIKDFIKLINMGDIQE